MSGYVKTHDGDGADFYYQTEGGTGATSGDPAMTAGVLMGGYRRKYCEFTRPANATQYAALDALADNAPSITTQVVAEVARENGGHGAIVRAAMYTDYKDWTNAITVVIYNAAPAGGFVADNSAFSVFYADVDAIVGMIQFPAFTEATDAANTAPWSIVAGLNIPFECVTVDDLYFQAYIPSGTPTPASGQKFQLELGVLQD